jgi:dihydropteroate synthase
VGILNVTPDSFSDGGQWFHSAENQDGLKSALKHAEYLIEAGADVIDIGGESTRPRSDAYGQGAQPVGAEEELRRVLPVVQQLARLNAVSISVDTSKASVAQACLDAGAEWINDVTALRGDPQMARTLAKSACGVVLMHNRGTPQTMSTLAHYHAVVQQVSAELGEQLQTAIQAGIHPHRLALDPGLGFAKEAEHDLKLLAEQATLLAHGRPLWVGPSRKRFIGQTLGGAAVSERDWGTAAAVTAAVLGGAHFVRVHDVAAHAQVCKVAAAIGHARIDQ